MILVSYIIPVLASRVDDLSDSLGSIQFGDINDFEVIVIINGTNRNEVDISRWSDPRYHFIFQTLASTTISRNSGIKMARGKWICFLDSDDVLLSSGVCSLVRSGEKLGSDLVVGDYRKIQDGLILPKQNSYSKLRVWAGNETNDFLVNVLSPRYEMGSVWAKVFLRSFLINNQLFFDEQLLNGEDYEFMTRVVLLAKQIVYVPIAVYGYTLNSLSVTKGFDCHFPQRNLQMLFKVKKSIFTRVHYNSNLDVVILFHSFCLSILSSVLLNTVFHTESRTTLCEKKELYKKYIFTPIFREALADTKAFAYLDRARYLVMLIARYNLFFPNFLILTGRHLQRHIHSIFHKRKYSN